MLLQNLRYGLRMMIKAPAFTIVAVLTLALGIGGNTALFGVVRAALLTPVPVPNPDRAVVLWSEAPRREWHHFPISAPDFVDFQQSGIFSHLGLMKDAGFNLRLGNRTERVVGQQFTGQVFDVLGRAPLMGRYLQDSDTVPGHDQVVVLTYQLWTSKFNSDPNIVGKTIVLDGTPREVVGVTPKGFARLSHEEIYTPLMLQQAMTDRGTRSFGAIGTLRDGLSFAAANQQVQQVAKRISQQYPASNAEISADLQPLEEAYVEDFRTLLLVLFGAIGFVLLIACANIANLLLTRGTAREKEMVIRAALGARRSVLAAQLLTESVLLALLGGALAIVPALWGMDIVKSVGGESLPNQQLVHADGRVVLFNFVLALLTGILFGLAPVWQVWRSDLQSKLKLTERTQGSLSHQRTRGALVVTEIALTLVLLVGAALTIRNFLQLRLGNPGYNSENALSFRIALAQQKYTKPEQQIAFFQELLRRVQPLPGVVDAGAIDDLPTADSLHGTGMFVVGEPEPKPEDVPIVMHNDVSPTYFHTMQIPLLRGRVFSDADTADSARVVIIDNYTAQHYFSGKDPVGRMIKTGRRAKPLQVVGVVGDVEQSVIARFLRGRFGQMYFPETQETAPAMNIVVRSANPTALVAPISNVVRQMDVDQPVFDVRTLEEARSLDAKTERLTTFLLGGFAVLALVLACMGIYGVVSFAVAQRTREIGIRLALGAQPGEILRMMLRQGVLLSVIGGVLGLVGAIALTRVLASLLQGIRTSDPLSFASVLLVLSLAAMLASYLPARRAVTLDPMIALRHE